MTAARMVARTVRGIEELVADEIRGQGVGAVDWIGHREVHLTTSDAATAVTALPCADDVLLLAATVDGVGHTKAGLQRLVRGLSRVDVAQVMGVRQRIGGSPSGVGIDVSASFVGRRTYSRFDIEDAVGEHLARVLGLAYHSRRHGDRPPAGTCSWRVTLDGPRATVALRIADRPAHRRGYKRATVAGTLHPPLAAAMVRLAGIRCGETVLDPCCGAGTLLTEGFRPGTRLVGVDRETAPLRAAATNAAGLPVTWIRADAGCLPLAGGSIDQVLVNPPWGRQVPARGILAVDPDRLWAESRRVLRRGGRLVALLHGGERQLHGVADHEFTVTATHPVRLAGAQAAIVVAVSGAASG